ncbi:AraC-like DNA-binding protein [Catenuloplanes nepalensis]|uniref:AraC-like DNA-binding protein n=1 Tax=Catenuloplanes nepalensis TaxID=587533 RepID=A0ABT9MRX0_9ACTN|nr:helix-turn-helix transcriptional regulator [Catenuloplanes nepalensis]MDP9794186.1 AraC-like DNA-binding protein [Catenuloplanes nepalensis]
MSQDKRTYAVDVTVPGGRRDAMDLLRHDWAAQVGDAIPIPPSQPVGDDAYRIRIRHVKLAGVVVEDIYSETILGGTGGTFNHLNDRLVLHMVHRGRWFFARANGRGETAHAPAGRFVARYNDPSWNFGIAARTSSRVLILPATGLRPLIGDDAVAGPIAAGPVRLLNAYVDAARQVLDDLPGEGVTAARDALVELVRGTLTGRPDPDEPLLTPALAAAARAVAEDLLAEPGLNPALIARQLHVSPRTLHRAFADGEPLMAYVRRRRVERALADLVTFGATLTVTEAGVRWGFTDGSHFVRACRALHGKPPRRYLREG